MTFCTECGARMTEGLKFCTSCGAPVKSQDSGGEAEAAGQTVSAAATLTRTPAYRPQPVPAVETGGRHAVMGTLSYIGTFILFAIPIAGLIFCIKWAFSGTVNLNRRNLARAMLVFSVIGLITGVLFAVTAAAWLNGLWTYLGSAANGQFGN